MLLPLLRMIPEAKETVTLLIVDDDEVSREVLSMLAEGEGYTVAAADSGEAALAWLGEQANYPDAVLADLQMPGISGDALAAALRSVCGPGTLLLAMSGSEPKTALKGYNGFLRKPFTMEELAAIASRPVAERMKASDAVVLDESTYAKLRETMGQTQLDALFAMLLTDAEKRLATMRAAVGDGDGVAYRSAAHAIKGGCGMVGAMELHRLAWEMEQTGLHDGSLDTLDTFVQASARLRSILVAQAS